MLALLMLIVSTLVVSNFYTTTAVSPLKKSAHADTPALLQFASSGHILGFNENGMWAATGSHALHVNFVNADKKVRPITDSTETTDAAKGKAVPLSHVVYNNLWSGITLTYSTGGVYTTTYTLAPNADVKDIQLHYNVPISLNKDGTLTSIFKTGTWSESAPIAWQTIQDQRVAVDVSFDVQAQTVGFKLGAYNPQYPLTIDPVSSWNTFLGGNGDDVALAIAVDSSGNTYVTGSSSSTWGSPVRAFTGSHANPFVAKLDSTGSLVWNTFLG
jgi:hypothetical protein